MLSFLVLARGVNISERMVFISCLVVQMLILPRDVDVSK